MSRHPGLMVTVLLFGVAVACGLGEEALTELPSASGGSAQPKPQLELAPIPGAEGLGHGPRPNEEAPDPSGGEPIACGDMTCAPPQECLTVVGSIQGAPKKQGCWIPCNDEKPCPEGMVCGMVHDGPGQVCSKRED